MNDATAPDIRLVELLRRELLKLAIHEDELAANQAAGVPYWAPTPASVIGHRAAAAALRDDADRISGLAALGTAAA